MDGEISRGSLGVNTDGIKAETNIDKKLYTTRMAENLKLLRAKLGLTQNDLCEKIGVSRQTIVQAENSGKLSWCTYLALVFLFSQNQGTYDVMQMFEIIPNNFSPFAESNIDKESGK